MRLQASVIIVGVVLMSYFGASIGRLAGVGSLRLALFALGVILLGQAPAIGLAARVRSVERQLASAREGAAAQAARADA